LSLFYNCGNTGIEKRFLFFRRLIPWLEFGRERDWHLSKMVLTHHSLRHPG
jgi:type I restriction enzyme R subunit